MVMATGFGLGRTSIFGEGTGAARTMSAYGWNFAFPAILISLMATKKFPSGSEMILPAIYYIVLYLFYFICITIIAPLFGVVKRERPIYAFSYVFGNMVFIGIPIVSGVYGDEGLRLLMMIVSFHSLTLLPVTTWLTESYSNPDASGLSSLGSAIIESLKNPIIIALIIGLSWSASELTMPIIIERFLALPAASAAPVGLFAIGLTLSRVKLKGSIFAPATIAAVTMKNIALPCAMYFATKHLMGMSDLWVGTATLLACMPSGVIAYTMADKYDTSPTRAASTIMVSTITSIFTLLIAMNFLVF